MPIFGRPNLDDRGQSRTLQNGMEPEYQNPSDFGFSVSEFRGVGFTQILL